MRIIYLGTPDFAVAPLKAIVENGFNGCAVGAFDKLAVCVAILADNAAGKE